MPNFLKNKSCLFFGAPDCSETEQCINELHRLEVNSTIVYSEKRGQKLPLEAKNWKGNFIFSYHNYWLLPSSIIENASLLALNFHPATPSFPGSGSYSWAIYEGVDKFGVTVHIMNEKFDNGKIIKVYKFSIDSDETLNSLIDKTKKFSVYVFKDFVNVLNQKTVVDIQKMKNEVSEPKWRGAAKTISDLDKMRKLDLDLSLDEYRRRIKAFHMDEFPVYIEKDGFRFIYRQPENRTSDYY